MNDRCAWSASPSTSTRAKCPIQPYEETHSWGSRCCTSPGCPAPCTSARSRRPAPSPFATRSSSGDLPRSPPSRWKTLACSPRSPGAPRPRPCCGRSPIVFGVPWRRTRSSPPPPRPSAEPPEWTGASSDWPRAEAGAPRLKETGNCLPVSDLAARTRSTQWSEDVARDGRLFDPDIGPLEAAESGARAALSAPLEWGEELMGVVTFHSSETRLWSASDIELLEAAAREVSVALHHAHAYDHAVRTAAKLREVDRMRRDLVSVVSHELRSPMTVIAGIADILKRRLEQTTPEARTELVDILGREARRLARLVSQVLDVEAIERGGLKLHRETHHLAELARAAVTDAGVAERARVIIEPGDALASLDADAIKQVFLNLLSNAAKFGPENSPITIVIAGDQDDVQAAIADEGPGIPEDEIPRLFQMFSRLDGAAGQPGSGVGLYASKVIVERHGGSIWVESAPGGGARFCFRLPR